MELASDSRIPPPHRAPSFTFVCLLHFLPIYLYLFDSVFFIFFLRWVSLDRMNENRAQFFFFGVFIAFTMRTIVFGTISTFQGAFQWKKCGECNDSYTIHIDRFVVCGVDKRAEKHLLLDSELVIESTRKCKLHENYARFYYSGAKYLWHSACTHTCIRPLFSLESIPAYRVHKFIYHNVND